MSDENENSGKKGSGKMIVGLVIGGAIASVLGLHLAPKKTKKLLKNKLRVTLDKIENKIHELEDDDEE